MKAPAMTLWRQPSRLRPEECGAHRSWNLRNQEPGWLIGTPVQGAGCRLCVPVGSLGPFSDPFVVEDAMFDDLYPSDLWTVVRVGPRRRTGSRLAAARCEGFSVVRRPSLRSTWPRASSP